MALDEDIIEYKITDPLELNLSYMPFITNGGLFIPTQDNYALGHQITVMLSLPGKKDSVKILSKVIWITPKNALHHVLPGIGVQFLGADSPAVRSLIESLLDSTMDVGGYTYGISGASKGEK